MAKKKRGKGDVNLFYFVARINTLSLYLRRKEPALYRGIVSGLCFYALMCLVIAGEGRDVGVLS